MAALTDKLTLIQQNFELDFFKFVVDQVDHVHILTSFIICMITFVLFKLN